MFFRKNNVYSAANKKEVNPMKKEMKNDKNNSERKMPKMQDADFCGQNLGIDAGNATASANETTGMMPTAPQNSAELEAAEELSPLQYTTLVKQKKRKFGGSGSCGFNFQPVVFSLRRKGLLL